MLSPFPFTPPFTRSGLLQRQRLFTALLVLGLASLITACSKKEEDQTAKSSGTVPYQMSANLPHAGSGDGSGKFASGEEAYNKICSYCHDAGVGPVLKGRQLPPEMIVAIARSGMRAMPAFTASFIDDQTLLEVGKFIQQSPAAAAKKGS